MGLRYILDKAETQATESTMYCIKVIESMQTSMRALTKFKDDVELKGKTYDSAKTFAMETHYPLAKGIIAVCEEIIQQNKKYPEEYRSDVATVSVDEDQVTRQIQQAAQQRQNIETLNSIMPNPLMESAIEIYREIEKQLSKKIQSLYAYNSDTAGNYDHAEQLLTQLRVGFKQMAEHQWFNPATGTFSTAGMDFGWLEAINKAWEVRAERKFAEKYE